MKIGIFFGGPAREREISFAGGKTAFEHLDQTLFEAIPVFVDSFGRFIKLKKEWMYQKGIRDFYPVQSGPYSLYAESFPNTKNQPVRSEIGELIQPQDFAGLFDFALLAMHGPGCEDGSIQGLLEWYGVPYSGPGIMGSAVGIDKVLQNEMIALVNGQQKKTATLRYKSWIESDQVAIYESIKEELGLPIVVKAPHQGSSIGVAIVKNDDAALFRDAVNQCFFQITVEPEFWSALSDSEKQAFAQKVANLDEGIGYPVELDGIMIYHPGELIALLDRRGAAKGPAVLLNANSEEAVLFEEFIVGQEFSCGCIQDENGDPLALPPTEIIKVVEVFDFNSKYKPGATRKRIPVETSLENNRAIQQNITSVFKGLGINVCVRIDGFLTPDNRILLHDPNTIPGMSPTSLIFKQMAEIGLNVTQTITYLIRESINQRITTGKDTVRLRKLLAGLDSLIAESNGIDRPVEIREVATDEDLTDVRNWWGKANAEGVIKPVVYFSKENETYRLSTPMLFKEYVEDIALAISQDRNPLLSETSKRAAPVTQFYGGDSDFENRRITKPAPIA